MGLLSINGWTQQERQGELMVLGIDAAAEECGVTRGNCVMRRCQALRRDGVLGGCGLELDDEQQVQKGGDHEIHGDAADQEPGQIAEHDDGLVLEDAPNEERRIDHRPLPGWSLSYSGLEPTINLIRGALQLGEQHGGVDSIRRGAGEEFVEFEFLFSLHRVLSWWRNEKPQEVGTYWGWAGKRESDYWCSDG
jgi:hypothetical protein